MTVTEYGFEVASTDHAALSLLAGGDDLFDLTQVAGAAETVPAYTATAMETGQFSGLAVADHLLSGNHCEMLPAHLLVASNDLTHADEQVAAKAAHETAPDIAHGTAVAIHGPADAAALAAADIFADASGDLAAFQTAAGGGHAPMGSGMFTPFNPAPLLDGLHAMAVLNHD
ncbi:MAG: hypothetical protein E6Q98_19260 [Rhodospirillaceae bacterium]|nr:MAG: hypothetical protein E6Q98_19260 [Rhodospirillaceae bacterium]